MVPWAPERFFQGVANSSAISFNQLETKRKTFFTKLLKNIKFQNPGVEFPLRTLWRRCVVQVTVELFLAQRTTIQLSNLFTLSW